MKISASMLEHHGRLGNQLFQVASVMGFGEKYGASVAFPSWKYEGFFEEPIPHGEMQPNQVKESCFHYHDWELNGDCDIFGYLQSEKYFGTKRLRFKKQKIDEVRKRHSVIFEKPTICIQVRRGDYVGNECYWQMPVTFYIDALLTHFPNWRDFNIVFTSDDIEYCRTHFECMPNAYFITGQSDIEDMILASQCDHFIISNSSYGWWCAWFGEKPGTKVIHSGYCFAGKLSGQDDQDYRPERWIKFKKDEYKIHFEDVTFTIPVTLDHLDRKRNLDISLCLLQSAFYANYIVAEQGGTKFSYTSQWCQYVRSDYFKFHRTKMLNDMAHLANTPIIVNWDADVIVPPMQLFMAVEELRNGADMVFPYDGRFGRMPRIKWFPLLEKALDIGIVRDENFKGRQHGHNSVGGAVMFNKAVFIDGGMENENMISFGPEDCERNDRFKRLGYDVRRIQGTLFHMDHYVGMNSSPANPQFKSNHAELEKIRKMSDEELRDYVNHWEWRKMYSTTYYHKICQGSIESAKIVMELLCFRHDFVLDVGCGVGEWHNGNPNYYGIDYQVKKEDLLIPFDHFKECNLDKDFPEINQKYDLVLCLEVAEHLRPHRAEGLVKTLCSLSDKVLFSAAIPFQGGIGHVNEQWQSWWANLFKQNGFGVSPNQPDIRNANGVELWYKNNMVLYERGATGIVTDFILPAYYMEIAGFLERKLS
jgi:hypothetical protein